MNSGGFIAIDGLEPKSELEIKTGTFVPPGEMGAAASTANLVALIQVRAIE